LGISAIPVLLLYEDTVVGLINVRRNYVKWSQIYTSPPLSPSLHSRYASNIACPVFRYCSRHGFTYIRGWMQMVLAPNDLFSWNNNTMSYILVMDMLHYCCPMHNDTYSVQNRSLKPWWSRLPCLQSFCYLFSPPLSGFNWRLTSPFGGPGPPTPKKASTLLGSPHTPFPGSGTGT
jgi:hypothetical protein